MRAYLDGLYQKTSHYSPAVGRAYPKLPPINTDIDSAFSNPLLVGRSKTRLRESCNAAIDELYIFEGHLNQDLVQALARAMLEEGYVLVDMDSFLIFTG